MTGAAAHLPEIERTGARRLIVTWFLLVAFALQSYVTQTHVHRAPATAERAPIVEVVGQISALSAAPANDEAIACPLCQAIVAAGAYFTPAATAFSALLVEARAPALPPIAAGLALAPAGFSWKSRAPPQS